MAIQPARLLLASTPDWGAAGTATTINATGESSGVVGQIRIAGGGTKTISAAGGGRILWSASAVTFATLGSTVRVGIQDVSAVTGLEDGSWDVYKEYVQGTDTINASSYNVATMSSGTKTLADGDLIAIVVEMTVLAGADSVVVGTTASGIITNTGGLGFPYGTVDTGSLAKNGTQYLYAVISFDDGTTGWILGSPLVRNAMTTVNFNSGSAFDEYCSIFSVPFKIRISGVSVEALNIAAATDTFEVILYRDPLGTPIPLVTLTPDQHIVANGSTSAVHMFHIPQTTLEAGVTYGVSLRPTSVNNITIAYISMGIVPATIVRAGLQMDNMKVGVRTDQTGAFATTDDLLPVFILDVCGLDDGVAGYLPVVP